MTVHAYPEARLVRIGDPGALAPAMRASITPIEETDRIDYRAWSGEYPHLSPEDLRGLPRALYLVSLAGPVDPDWLPRFEASGLSLLDHANPYSILVRGDGDGLRRATTVRTSAGFPVVKSVVPLPIEARLDATLLELASGRRRVEEIPGLLRTADGAAVVRALPFPDGDSESLLFQVGQHLAKVEPRLAHGYDDAFAARGPELPALLKDLEEIAHLEVVHERELHNNLAAKSYILNIEPVWSSLGYNGAGVIVGHNDSGVSLTHPDFPTGVVIATAGAMSGTNNEHGTHVAGSVVGRGLAAGSPTNTSGCGDVTPPLSTVRGMAWGASLVANNIFDGGYTTETSMMQWSYGQGARLSTNSWGYTNDYNYDSYAVSVDTLVRDAATTAGNQELAILFSAGNSGSGASTVGSPGTAKNALTVGASQNDRCGSYVPSQQSGPNINTITTFSSRGPSQGRIKPDVVAVGADVLSVDSLNCSGTPRDPCEEGWDQAWTGTYYRLMPGTSMSTPITAGASAVFFEFFNSTFGANPSPALTKAAMINGAVDIGVGYPSYSQGWGRINLRQSIEGPPGGRINFLEQSASRLLTTGTNFTKTFPVFSTSPRLKITLVWTDPPGTAGSTAPLRNNLDLVVTAPSGTVYRGNQFTGAWSTPNASGSDTANNVENVFVQTPETGQWSVEVRGINVAANPPNLAGQDWAVVYSGDCADCSPLPAPSGLGAAVHSDNRIDLTWNSVPGAVDYRIYRSTTAGGPYSYLATVTAPTLSYADTSVAAGATYYYVVRSFGSGGSACESGNSNEASATATGVCDLPPLFTGISSATPQGDCSVTLSWAAGTAQCAGPVRYTIYRHTATPFTPDVSNRIATGVTGTTYSDASGFAASTTYHYIVQAVDESNGVEGTNAVSAAAMPTGALAEQVLFQDTFETGSGLNGWGVGVFSPDTTGTNCRGIQACTAYSGTRIFRFGGEGCTDDYSRNANCQFTPGAPAGADGLSIPSSATNTRLTFRHKRQFAAGDGAMLRISSDNATFYYIPASAPGVWLQGGYNGTITYGTGTRDVWNGTSASYPASSSFVMTEVDLDATCNYAFGGTSGCAGRTIWIGLGAFTDNGSNTRADGWFLDDVLVTAMLPGACGGTPRDVEHLTVTSRQAGACTVEWQNPPGLPVAYGATRIG
ncbi:MAG: S8 family serine peptidase, partial [Thermoanaerobaculia bacterium]|nr:S8 family serine peptidase [Thermoanaerobaculia bacterium]